MVADKIKVPFDLKHNFHPEFDGYEPGEWTPSPSRAALPPSEPCVHPGRPLPDVEPLPSSPISSTCPAFPS